MKKKTYLIVAIVVTVLTAAYLGIVPNLAKQTNLRYQKFLAGWDASATSKWEKTSPKKMLELCKTNQVFVRGGYDKYGRVDFYDDGNFYWLMRDNPQYIERCREAKPGKKCFGTMISLNIRGFRGNDPAWWVALSLSRLSPQASDRQILAWKTLQAVDKMVSDAESDPQQFLDEPRIVVEGKIDRATLDSELPDKLSESFLAQDDVNQRWDDQEARRIELEGEVANILLVMNGLSRIPHDPRNSLEGDVDAVLSKMSQLRRELVDKRNELDGMQSKAEIREEITRQQRLLDRAKAEVKRRLYAAAL